MGTKIRTMTGCPNCLDTDSDGDGIPDVAEGSADSDGDGTGNYLDTDSDNDGIPDAVEGTDDPDFDWVPNYLDGDSDNDGIADSTEGTGDPDIDWIPNYLDPDSDGDTIPDAMEGSWDADWDGIPNFLDLDSDGDGLDDSVEGTGDPDGDWLPNYLDADSDGDGIPDSVEGAADIDAADGIPNYLDLDSDGDRMPDEMEIALGYDPYDAGSECWSLIAAQAESLDFDAILAACYDWPYDGSYPFQPYSALDGDFNVNTIPDSVEFALLAAVLADPAAPRIHDLVHDAFTQNALQNLVRLWPAHGGYAAGKPSGGWRRMRRWAMTLRSASSTWPCSPLRKNLGIRGIRIQPITIGRPTWLLAAISTTTACGISASTMARVKTAWRILRPRWIR